MSMNPPSQDNISLPFLEFALAAIGSGLCFVAPRMGSGFFRHIEQFLSQIALHKRASVVLVGVSALLLRLAILPFCPIPLPFCNDDFSFLLAADTFAHGRLANPTPAMWIHFESLHIDMLPTYGSMYFPGEGLILAAGKLLFGLPWLGVVITGALMCAAICWMLQAWLPPRWAFLGGVIAILHLQLFSYWANSYHSGGTLAALGGALILGSLPRLKKTALMRYGILMALGIAIQVLTRPYEGFLLCLPVAISLAKWTLHGKNRPHPLVLARRASLPLLIIAATLAWLGYYDKAAFGKATTLPYTINRQTYAVAPYFVWQDKRPTPVYRHADIARFYLGGELAGYREARSKTRFLKDLMIKCAWTIYFFAGFALLPPLLMIRRVFLDRRTRFLVLGTLLLACGMLIQIFTITHYVAAFTACFYAIGLQAMRHLRVWRPQHKPVGFALTRVAVSVCVVMSVVRLFATPLGMEPREWPVWSWNFTWYGPGRFGTERASIEAQLERQPGQQLAIVYHGARRNPIDEWVYNGADIDSQKVIWARDMDVAHNSELIQYYKGRQVWLVNADRYPAALVPYSPQAEASARDVAKNGPMPDQALDQDKESTR